MYKDNQERICYQASKFIGGYPTLLAEVLVIREAVIETVKPELSNVIIESDSHVTIRAILGKIKAPSSISNMVADICIFSISLCIVTEKRML